MIALEGRERLRQWANADNVQDLGARVAAHEVIAELEAAERDLEEAECELAHAYWDSCGCLAGGMGHRSGTAGYPCSAKRQSDAR
jgi:hypothetical protein